LNIFLLKPSAFAANNTLSIINRLRLISVVGQLVVIVVAVVWLRVRLEIEWLLFIVAVELVFCIYAFYRQRQISTRYLSTDRQSHTENFIQLLFNSLSLSGLIYWSGGSSNPFIYFLLLDLALATILLSPRFLLVLAAIQIGLYSLLHLYAPPLQIPKASPLSAFHLHLVGMWISFVVTTSLIVFFGLLVRLTNRRQAKQIQQLRESQLRDEQLLGIAVLAASATHELGTPISTVATLLESLETTDQGAVIGEEELTLLRQQIDRCRQLLLQLKETTQRQKTSAINQQSPDLGEALKRLIRQWHVYRPEVKLKFDSALITFRAELPVSIGYALTNLLNNAADASMNNQHYQVDCNVRIAGNWLVVDIIDQGKGITELAKASPGQSVLPSQKGLGWGLFLSNASIERVGGKVQLLAAEHGGTLTRVSIPLEAFKSPQQVII